MATVVGREEQERLGLVRKNFVAPATTWEVVDDDRPAPSMALDQSQPTDAVVIDAGGGRSFQSIQGSYHDHAGAMMRKFGAVVAAEAFAVAGLLLLAGLQGLAGVATLSAGWLVLTALAALGTFVLLDRSEHQHSPVGAERHRVSKAAEVATSTHEKSVDAWTTVSLAKVNRYYDYLEKRDNEQQQQIADRRRQLSDRE